MSGVGVWWGVSGATSKTLALKLLSAGISQIIERSVGLRLCHLRSRVARLLFAVVVPWIV